jgi:hypothetical protein
MNTEALDPIETYARVMADIGAGKPRGEVLAAHGLDEVRFEAIEKAAFADVGEGVTDAPVIPEADLRLDRAFREARDRSSDALLSIEEFARAAAVAQEGVQVSERLTKMGVSLQTFLKASGHYAPRLAREPELAARFNEVLSEKKTGGR